jgi:hypothetical protein
MGVRTMKPAVIVAALGGLFASGPVSEARGCSCGVISDGFKAVHPRSIAVAIAVRDSIDAGVIEPDECFPNEGGSARDLLRLSTFYRRLAEAMTGNSVTPEPFALMLIDSGLVHTGGVKPGSAMVVTHAAILTAILEGRLAAATALAQGLIALDGDPAAVDSVRRLLLEGI